jgi:2-succinyl-6-hydroxy-2,4-cyclohexadiene-1-carboxylate synthase
MSQTIPHQLFGNQQKPVIFFLHGFMGEISDFNFFYGHLKDDFCLVGLSYPIVDTNFNDYLQQLKSLIDKFPAPRYFVGYSMGGRIGLGLSFNFSGIFKKQIIISAHPGLGSIEENNNRYMHDQKILNEIHNEESWPLFLNKWYQQELFGKLKSNANFNELLEKKFNKINHYKAQLKFFSLGLQNNYWSQKTPTNFIVGELDKKYLKIGEKFIQKSSNHQLSIISNAGHKCYFEAPEEILFQITNTFLN